MWDWLARVSEPIALVIDTLALCLVVAGTLEACVLAIGVAVRTRDAHALRTVWLRYARWLVGALTMQLGADIIESSTARGWDTLGRLAATAAIRTFLNFFLERDVEAAREGRPAAPEREARPPM